MRKRIEPTHEDLLIFERNLSRMMRWVRANPSSTPLESAAAMLNSIKRFTNDYIETGGSK